MTKSPRADALAVIETDKASFDLESTASGTILELFWEADDDAPVLANVAAVGKEGEDASEFRPADSESSAAESDATPSQDPAPVSTVEAQPAAASTAPSETPSPASASSGVSPRARKLASSQGVDAETIVGSGPGGRVIERGAEAFLAGRPYCLSAPVPRQWMDLSPQSVEAGWQGWLLPET